MTAADIKRRLERLERSKPGRAGSEVPADPAAFFTLATGYEPIDWQRRFLTSEANRVLLNLSRQGAKSTTTGVVAVHKAIHNPDSLILIGAPGSRQSSELLTKCKRVYQAVGSPLGYEGDSATRLEFKNGSRIVALPANADLIRGFSAPAAILLDEASRIPDDVIDAVSPMMASNPGCLLVAMSTPAGTRGWWWDLWENGGPAWERYFVTADDIPWITLAFLAQERERMTEAVYLEEYYCKPHAGAASVFSREVVQAAISDEFRAWRL